MTTPVPDPSGTNGSNAAFTSSTVYDLTTGLPTSSTDANGQTTYMEYNDVLLRPTRVVPPSGGAITDTSILMKIDYDYGTSTTNNGSLKEQAIALSGYSGTIVQSYTYGNLNRI